MDFREAIMALKEGRKIGRTRWEKNTQYLLLMKFSEDGLITKVDDYTATTLGIEKAVVSTRIDQFDGNKLILERWIAAPEDISADDWYILPAQLH